jgi:hypothetical protein
MELLSSARNAGEFADLREELDALPEPEMTRRPLERRIAL